MDEVDLGHYGVASLGDLACQHCVHTQLTADFLRLDCLAFKAKNRRSSDHF